MSSLTFQFLMVRLKAIGDCNPACIAIISIPYGAIKRLMKITGFASLEVISIPYGAIKRVAVKVTPEASSKFQFLMVRLKDFYLIPIPF